MTGVNIESPIFQLESVGVKATAQLRGDQFVVFKGSQARVEVVDGYEKHVTTAYKLLRSTLIDQGKLQLVGDVYVFTEDVAFDAPTPAAIVVTGRNDWGSKNWRRLLDTGQQQTYGQWLQENRASLPQSITAQVLEPVVTTWQPFFHDLAHKLLEYEDRQPELVQLLRDAGVSVQNDEGEPLTVLDPFSFFSLILKHTSFKSVQPILVAVRSSLDLQAELPTDLMGVPWSNPMNAWFFAYRSNRQPDDLRVLWALARQAVQGQLEPDTFAAALRIRQVKLAKLTQGLFWLNPQAFLPLNSVNVPYIEARGVRGAGKVQSLTEFDAVLDEARSIEPDFVTLSHTAWLESQHKEIVASALPAAIQAVGTTNAEPLGFTSTPGVLLNQIFYGPPGTGKTYRLVDEALRILEPATLDAHPGNAARERKIRKARYDALVADGQITFTTFHQSFGYEDFIEGIKPVMRDGQLHYELEDGLFLQAVRAAGGMLEGGDSGPAPAGADAVPGVNPDGQVWRIYIDGTAPVSQLRQRSLERGEIRIGSWLKHPSAFQDRVAVNQTAPQDLNTLPEDELHPQQIMFRDSVRIGDLVLLATGQDSISAVGVVTGDYFFDQSENIFTTEYSHVRPIQWLAKNLSWRATELSGKKFAPATLQRVLGVSAQRVHALLNGSAQVATTPVSALRPHVLIIDEINRGNVAKVFGELITLLEPSKRAGAAEGLTVRLPLSKRQFSVPQSLYIIGTMNTADRSLTSLDAALRRRFVFHPVWPDPSVLPKIPLEGTELDLAKFLTAINQRIERLLSREQVIGHAYLLDIPATLEGVAQALQQRILPLLEEYFFEDWSLIRQVLGDDTDKPSEQQFIRKVIVGDAQRFERNPQAFESIEAFVRVYSGASDLSSIDE